MGGLVGGLLIAWILTWFGVHNYIIQGLFELFNLNIDMGGYYVLFAIVGVGTELFSRKK